jgi:O-antigen/teichoic acid export membrane protein
MIFGGPFVAHIYKTPEIKIILLFAGLAFFLRSIYSVPRALLIKNMQQNIISKLDVLENFMNGGLIIIFAKLGFKYLSYVIPSLITTILICTIYLVITKWNYSIKINNDILKQIVNYSKSYLPKTLLWYFVYNTDYIFVGFLLGSKLLGYYYFGYEKAMILILLTGNIGVNLFAPMFSKAQIDKTKLEELFFDIVKKQNYILYPLIFIQIILAKEIVDFIYGSRWNNSLFTYKLILTYIFLRAVSANIHVLFDAVGRPDLNLKYFVLIAPLCVATLYIGTLLGGLTGISIAACLIHSVGALILYKLLCNHIGCQYKKVLLEPLKPLICLIIQLPILIPLINYMHYLKQTNYVIIFAVLPIYIGLYIIISRILIKDIYDNVFKVIISKMKNKLLDREEKAIEV